MTSLKELIPLIQATNHTPEVDLDAVEITGGYVSDMLSDVMGSASPGQIWVTIMKHLNVIAVASMTGISVIIFAKGIHPDATVIEKALEEGIVLLSSPLDTFKISGITYQAIQS